MNEKTVVLYGGKVRLVKDLNQVKWVGHPNYLVVDGKLHADKIDEHNKEKHSWIATDQNRLMEFERMKQKLDKQPTEEKLKELWGLYQEEHQPNFEQMYNNSQQEIKKLNIALKRMNKAWNREVTEVDKLQKELNNIKKLIGMDGKKLLSLKDKW